MKLTDLNPRWFAEEGRHGQGVTFECPHCRTVRLGVAFAQPLDGGPQIGLQPGVVYPLLKPPDSPRGTVTVPPGTLWSRSGEAFDALTLSPSVDCSASGHWHGFVQNGECR